MSAQTKAINNARVDELFATVQTIIETAGVRIAKRTAELLVEEVKSRIISQKGVWKNLADSTIKRKSNYKRGKFSENATKKWIETGGFLRSLKSRQTRDGAEIFFDGSKSSRRSKTPYGDVVAINEEVRPLFGPAFKKVKSQMQAITNEAMRKQK